MKFVRSHYLYVFGALILVATAFFLIWNVLHPALPEVVTHTIERGDVAQFISVSGFVEAKNTAQLGFPTGGTILDVPVTEGTVVEAGTVLATLNNNDVEAQRAQAVAARASAQASLQELLAGASTESRDISSKNVAIAAAQLERVIALENEKVATAKKTLLSSSLQAFTDKESEDAVPPVISGSYICNAEGTYNLELYRSGANSRYSMNITGLEDATSPVSFDQALPFGTCGLRAIFDASSDYSNSTWRVTIPNTASSLYTTNKNAYELAKTQAANNIESATQALTLAKLQDQKENALPRTEAIAKAQAMVAEAEASIAQIDARLTNLVLTAPFAGTVTSVSALKGESVTSAPIITLVAENRYVLKARIPEIDVTTVETNQPARITFDAEDTEVYEGVVSFISPAPTVISGVTYYETEITLTNPPSWLRGGLNADVEILVKSETNALRVPRRFLFENDGVYTVSELKAGNIATTTIDVTLLGNDGFAAVSGITEGSVITIPK